MRCPLEGSSRSEQFVHEPCDQSRNTSCSQTDNMVSAHPQIERRDSAAAHIQPVPSQLRNQSESEHSSIDIEYAEMREQENKQQTELDNLHSHLGAPPPYSIIDTAQDNSSADHFVERAEASLPVDPGTSVPRQDQFTQASPDVYRQKRHSLGSSVQQMVQTLTDNIQSTLQNLPTTGQSPKKSFSSTSPKVISGEAATPNPRIASALQTRDYSGKNLTKDKNQAFSSLTYGGDNSVIIETTMFKDCSFQQCIFQKNSFRGCTFKDCSFVQCSIQQGAFQNCGLKDCSFRECAIQQDSDQQKVDLDSKIQNNASLRSAFLECDYKDCSFQTCSVEQDGFLQCALKDVKFQKCEIQRGSFQMCGFRDCAFACPSLPVGVLRADVFLQCSFKDFGFK